jgi:hypothetical protein
MQQQLKKPQAAKQQLIEIYDPPYRVGARPIIASCPSVMSYRKEIASR